VDPNPGKEEDMSLSRHIFLFLLMFSEEDPKDTILPL